MDTIKITECPRDAMQGLHNFVSTDIKAYYINLLLQCGFATIDFGSFVSPKAIPQLRDTAAVLDKLDLENTTSKLLAVAANYRGANEAALHDQITYIGYPFSISETFQKRNTNSTMEESFDTVKSIQQLCGQRKKQLRVYLSMGFGNPYGDEWNVSILLKWVDALISIGVSDIYIADTIGIATAEQIAAIFKYLNIYSKIQLGAHLHSSPDTWYEKIDAAYQGGCRWFDTTIKGYGGCPMATDKLTGNIATESLLGYLQQRQIDTGVDAKRFADAIIYADKIFNSA